MTGYKQEEQLQKVEEMLNELWSRFNRTVHEEMDWEKFEKTWDEKKDGLSEKQRSMLWVSKEKRIELIEKLRKERSIVWLRIQRLEADQKLLLKQLEDSPSAKGLECEADYKLVEELKKQQPALPFNSIIENAARMRGKSKESVKANWYYFLHRKKVKK